LRGFTCRNNHIPDDIYPQDRHFWEVLMHKLIYRPSDLLGLHDDARGCHERHGYTADLGGV
jgi:hypothetical protein